MATSTEDAVDPTKVEEESKDTLEADKTVADEQKDDTTPAATSDAVADDAVKSKDEASAPEGPESDRTLSPAPTLVIDHVRMMQAGSEMMKVKGNKQYHRTFWLDEALTTISWNSASKKPFKARIPLSLVKEVRRGASTDSFKSSGKTFEDEKCFSVIYDADFKTLDLLCPTADEAEIWINGIMALRHHTDSAAMMSLARDKYIKSMFEAADRNNDGTLDFHEIVKLMKQLNVGLSKRVLKKKFKEVDDDLNGSLDFDEFSNLFKDMATRQELWNLFIKHSSRDFMSAADMQTFLEVEQRDSKVSLEDCEELITLYECSEEGKEQKKLSFDGFTAFMLGQENDIFNFNHKAVYQDMNQPLSHYYIYSSHNTYLLGDQLRSESSVEAYIRALHAGCRCVELDCWDGEDDEPIIYHGHTLTSKILFKDVITAIKEHAFSTSQFPVILSIENHCSIKQQNIMAEYMVNILGDLLHMDPVDEGNEYLPSPEALLRKVLIKGKKLAKDLEQVEVDDDDDGADVSDEDEAMDIDPHDIDHAKERADAGEDGVAAPTLSPTPPGRFRRTFSFRRRERQDSQSSGATAKESTPAKKIKLGRKLSKTVNYVQSVSFKGFSDAFKIGKYYHMSSFGEVTAFKLKNQSATDFCQYNKRQISRIYPAGKRIDSSNYDPVEMWNMGCQIVALNLQTPGSKMDYNVGKFQQNGACGYLLKPNVMRSEVSLFDCHSREPIPGVIPKTYTVKVISGQHLPKPLKGSATGEIIDPYVRLEVKGLPCDTKEFKTKYISDNGFNPMWNETITFTVQFPELCLLRFVVYDSDTISDDFIGQYTLPLESVEKGYRHVHLHTPTWEKIEHASIFVHVTIHEAHHFNIKKLISSKATIDKARRTRKYPEPHYVSIPDVDKIFRSSTYLMRESCDLREDYHFFLLKFKGLVDAKAEASLKECVWLMAFKAKHAKIEIVLKKKGQIFEVDSKTAHVPNSIAVMFSTFNELNNATVPILDRADDIRDQLKQIFEQAFKKRKDIQEALTHFGLNAKKITKGVESYSWTMQLLQSEMILISSLNKEAQKNLDEILEAADRVQLEIVEEKVPTIEEAKSFEAIVDVAAVKSDSDEDKPTDTTAETPASEPTVEVITAVISEKVENQPPESEPTVEVVTAVISEKVESQPSESEPTVEVVTAVISEKVESQPPESEPTVEVVTAVISEKVESQPPESEPTIEVVTAVISEKVESQPPPETDQKETEDVSDQTKDGSAVVEESTQSETTTTIEVTVDTSKADEVESTKTEETEQAKEPEDTTQTYKAGSELGDAVQSVAKEQTEYSETPKESEDEPTAGEVSISITMATDDQQIEVTTTTAEKEKSPTPEKEKSPTPEKERSSSPETDKSSSPDKEKSPSPDKEKSPSAPSAEDADKRPESSQSQASSSSSSSSSSSHHTEGEDKDDKETSPQPPAAAGEGDDSGENN